MLTESARKDLESVMPVVFNRMSKLKSKFNMTDDQAQEAYLRLVERWAKLSKKIDCRPTTVAANAIGWSCLDVVQRKQDDPREYPLENDYGYTPAEYSEPTQDVYGVTPFQFQVMCEMAKGQTIRQVAEALDVGKTLVHNELVKLREMLT
jgi:hypothetical protein